MDDGIGYVGGGWRYGTTLWSGWAEWWMKEGMIEIEGEGYSYKLSLSPLLFQRLVRSSSFLDVRLT